MYMSQMDTEEERKTVEAITHKVMEFLSCTNDTEAYITYDASLHRTSFTVRSAFAPDRFNTGEKEPEETEDEEDSE